MKNLKLTVHNGILHIEVDLSQSFGLSKTGKTVIVATSSGNVPVAEGCYLGINVYKYLEKKEGFSGN